VGRMDIVLFAMAVTLIPALGIWAVGAVTGVAGSSARRGAHLVPVTDPGPRQDGGIRADATLLPATAFREGRNDLSLFILRQGRVEPIRLEG
ncbi:MAG TPA: hypothetical protein VGA70_09185, partial [Longimicrobiales bacterium]